MMKQYIYSFFSIISILIIACNNNDYSLGDADVPTNLSFSVTPSTDGSGSVEVNYSAEGALNHRVVFKDITDASNPITLTEKQYDSNIAPSTFNSSLTGDGEMTFRATYYAYGVGSVVDSLVEEFTMFIDRPLPIDIVQKLTNSSSKTWHWDRNNGGHLGVGPNNANWSNPGELLWPSWYQAAANEKPECLYNDIITFTKEGNKVKMELANQGDSYIQVDHQQSLVGSTAGQDACFSLETTGFSYLTLEDGTSYYPDGESTKVFINTGSLFMSYALETNIYEIVSISPTTLYVRCTDVAPDGTQRAWYLRFVSDDSEECADGFTGNSSGTGSYTLIWEDNFDTDGAPCSNNWIYDVGAGGWGNGEAQYYTDRINNSVIENGVLKINATKEIYLGSEYTSARLKTNTTFDFQYGRVEVKAKLPTTGGSWPAIWMLGSNFNTVGWPDCGEIDIMEHVGNNANTIINAIHTPSSFGNTVNVQQSVISDVTQFHIYSLEWTPTSIKFFVDNILKYTYAPSVQDASTWPFNSNMFLILNVAVGGTLGGAISSNFTTATMEIDYVKVYQQ